MLHFIRTGVILNGALASSNLMYSSCLSSVLSLSMYCDRYEANSSSGYEAPAFVRPSKIIGSVHSRRSSRARLEGILLLGMRSSRLLGLFCSLAKKRRLRSGPGLAASRPKGVVGRPE